MLIETPIAANDVVSIKMIGGDEIVARIVENDSNSYNIKIKYPLLVFMSGASFGMVPFMLTVDHSATHIIERKHIISMKKTYKEIADQYLQQTTGLRLTS